MVDLILKMLFHSQDAPPHVKKPKQEWSSVRATSGLIKFDIAGQLACLTVSMRKQCINGGTCLFMNQVLGLGVKFHADHSPLQLGGRSLHYPDRILTKSVRITEKHVGPGPCHTLKLLH